MQVKHFVDLCRRAVMAWIDDYAPSMGAAISYYTIFSMAPLLVIVIAIAGALFGHDAAQHQIVAEIGGMVGKDNATVIEALLRSATKSGQGLLAGGISIVVLLVGATTVFAELQSALDRIWHVPERDKPTGVWAVLRARVLSFGLILGLAFLLIVSLLVSAGLSALDNWFGGLLPGWDVLLQGLNELFSIGILTLLFAAIYKMMPTAPIAWRDVWIGALVTSLLFEVGKLLIGLYLTQSGVQQSFAAAGSLVVLVAWVYYAAQIFLLGAEFTKAYADAHGSLAASAAAAATQAIGDERRTGGLLPAEAIAGRVAADMPDYAGLGRTADAQKEVDHRVEEATGTLARQLAVLGAVTAANLLLDRWTRQQRKARRAIKTRVGLPKQPMKHASK